MLNENAKKWVAALRSGEYQQAYMNLKTYDSRYCCLGVACDIYCKATGLDWDAAIGRGPISLPKSVMEFFGVRDDAGKYNNQSECLMRDNDSHRKTFAQIADIIESEPEGLFVK